MSTTIYVGNLPDDLSDKELRQIFEEQGEVTKAVVVRDRNTGRSRGFGFVEMSGDADSIAAFDLVPDSLSIFFGSDEFTPDEIARIIGALEEISNLKFRVLTPLVHTSVSLDEARGATL